MWIVIVLVIVAAVLIGGYVYRRNLRTRRQKLVQDNPAIVRVLLSLEPQALSDLFKLYRFPEG
jgi:hypothetical protein